MFLQGDADVATDFKTRYGFLREPARIRFRVLDPFIRFAGLSGCPDVELDEDSFAELQVPVLRVFATENKTNFLAFPVVAHSIIVFGAGYGMRAFGRAHSIRQVPLYYWGDIDTHGYKILSDMRDVFPHTQSFLMDRGTMECHQESWTTEAMPTRCPCHNLDSAERAVLSDLQQGCRWYGLRLEQEKIALTALHAALSLLLKSEKPISDS